MSAYGEMLCVHSQSLSQELSFCVSFFLKKKSHVTSLVLSQMLVLSTIVPIITVPFFRLHQFCLFCVRVEDEEDELVVVDSELVRQFSLSQIRYS